MSRERLLLYFWPESTTANARNSLNQLLHGIRKHLGGGVVVGTTVLRLNPERITCDLWEYEAAVARGDLETAVALRRGELLGSFTVPGVPEFEQWLEEERTREATRFREQLERRAVSAAREGRYEEAVRWWRRVAVQDPLSARVTTEYMRVLAACGDVPEAIAQAEAYSARVREQLETEAGPDVLGFEAALRRDAERFGARAHRAAAAPTPPAEPQPSSVPSASVPADVPTPAPPVPAAADASDADRGAAPARSRVRLVRRSRVGGAWSRLRRPAVALGIVLLPVTGWGVRAFKTSARPAATAEGSAESVLVFPFSIYGGGDPSVGSGVASLLAAGLDGAGTLRAMPAGGKPLHADDEWPEISERAAAIAAQRGAGAYILGDIVSDGNGRLRVRAQYYDRVHGRTEPVQAFAGGAASDLLRIADTLTVALLRNRAGWVVGASFRNAAVGTTSPAALRAYLDGETALQADHLPEAVDAFSHAIAADSLFGLAYCRLILAADWAGQASVAGRAMRGALALSARLPEHDQLLLRALDARRSGRATEAERLYQLAADRYPRDPEAWFGLAEVLFHGNSLRGRSARSARPALERVLALDPENAEALIHLARIAAVEGRPRAADSLVNRARAITPDSDVVESVAFRAYALGDPPGLKRVTRDLLAHPGRIPETTALRVAVYVEDLGGIDRFARTLMDSDLSADTRAFAQRLLAQLAFAEGRLSAGRQELAESAALDSIPALELESLYLDFPFHGAAPEEARALGRRLEEWNPAEEADDPLHNEAHEGLHPALRLYGRGLVALASGDVGGAGRAVAAIEALPGTERTRRLATTLAWSLRARIAAKLGRPAEALAALDRAEWEPAASVFIAEATDRFLRAELLHALGHDAEALGWYASIAERATYELVYLAPAELRQAEIYDRLGEAGLAATHYRRVVELWRDCDPELRPLRDRAQRRLGEYAQGAGAR